MPSVAPPHRVAAAIRAAAVSAAVVAGGVLAGCGVPPELQPKPGSSVPRPSETASPSAADGLPGVMPLLPGETATPSPVPSFAEDYAIPCGDYPSKDQVITAVRRTGGLLPSTGTVTVLKGPLCAGSWQYTIFAVPQKEPLQVVTRGTPTQLTLVTAGTDICSITVRTSGPPGIRNAALCPPAGA